MYLLKDEFGFLLYGIIKSVFVQMSINLDNFGKNSCNHIDMCDIKLFHGKYLDIPDSYTGFFVDSISLLENSETPYINWHPNVAGHTIRFAQYELTETCHKNLREQYGEYEDVVKLFCQIKEEMYSMNEWYDAIKDFTIPTKFIHNSDDNKIGMLNNLFKNLPVDLNTNFFAKLDTVSAKDIHKSGIYENEEHLMNIFKKSPRILYDINHRIHVPPSIIIRPIIQMDVELRCFVYNKILTAVSAGTDYKLTDKIRTKVNEFFNELLKKLPYPDAVVDVFITENSIKVIEINDFGGYTNTCAGQYNWRDDLYILYNKNCKKFDFRNSDIKTHSPDTSGWPVLNISNFLDSVIVSSPKKFKFL